MFYSELCNLVQDHKDPNLSNSRTDQIRDFISQFFPKPITTQQAEELDNTLTAEELNMAVNQMKVGKSPGPDGLPL